MSKKLYKTPQQVAEAIKCGNVKRNSVLVMKRQAKVRGDEDYSRILEDGVELYDELAKGNEVLYCSYYKKNIRSLSLYELVMLEKDHPELFTHYHTVRYSMLMLGEVGELENYKGMLVTPNQIRNL